MENVERMRTYLLSQHIFEGMLASKLLDLNESVMDQNIIIHTNDQLVKKIYLNALIARYNLVTVTEIEGARTRARATSFSHDGGKPIAYVTHALFTEIDMDTSNVWDVTTFREFVNSICSHTPIASQRHLVIMCRVDRSNVALHQMLARVMHVYHSSTAFILTCDTISKCPVSSKSCCLAINLCLSYSRLYRLCEGFIDDENLRSKVDVILERSRRDTTNFALITALPTPASFVGHLSSLIATSVTDLVRLSTVDNIAYANGLRELIIKIGASCADPVSVGRIIIALSETMQKDTCMVAALTSEMQSNVIKVNKTIFTWERYIHRIVKVLR